MLRTTRRLAGIAGASLWLALGCPMTVADDSPKRYTYPPAPRSETVDDYHGTKVADPYRPLEDPDAPETHAWVEAQNKITYAYLAEIPQRDAIRKRLTTLWNYERFGIPQREGGRYFFTRNDGLQNQAVLYTAPGLDAPPRVLLDPNTLAKDGTVALSGMEVSDDGKLLAYGIAVAGSDWNEWRVRDVETGQDRDDHLKWIKFSAPSWTKDNRGFFYGRFPEPAPGTDLKGGNYYQKVYYHEVGTPQGSDKLIWEDPEHKDWRADGQVSDDGAYLILTLGKGTDHKHRVFFRKVAEPDAKPVHLVGDFEADYTFLGNDGPVFWFRTDKDAPRGRVIAIDTRAPAPDRWKVLIPEAQETLQSAHVVGDRFLVHYLKDARSQVKVFGLDGTFAREVELPGIGTAAGFRGKRSEKETFYAFTSATNPSTIYRYDVESGQSRVFRRPKVDFNPDDFETTQVFYRSKDGTRIPMFLSAKKGLKRDGKTPTLLYGYGGFNLSQTPSFTVPNLAWMEMGGLLAIPNLRGGGEYGEAWHQGGTKLKKQNVFDDFIAAAEYLIDEGFTSRPKLAIHGRSNGGLLVGACINQRPDLFAAAVPGVGVMDMLRFHKFTIGWAWTDDYGSPDDPEQFRALHAYSPLHNLKPGTAYPATLVTTADHDDRVVPAHSFKYAATLQAAHSGEKPVLIRVETRSGHREGKPTAKLIDDATDQLAFLVHELGVLPAGLTP